MCSGMTQVHAIAVCSMLPKLAHCFLYKTVQRRVTVGNTNAQAAVQVP